MGKEFYFPALGLLLVPGQSAPVAVEVFGRLRKLPAIQRYAAAGYLELFEHDIRGMGVEEISTAKPAERTPPSIECDPDTEHQITEISFGRLMGYYKADGKTFCNHNGCESLAICFVVCENDVLHPSCEEHAKNHKNIIPLS